MQPLEQIRPRPAGRRRGVGKVEVIVVVLVLSVLGMLVLVDLPRRREVARSVGCESNLMQIGTALGQYMAATDRLPATPGFGSSETLPADCSPLGSMLSLLGVESFDHLDPKAKPNAEASQHAPAHFVPGFLCPSDAAVLIGGAGRTRPAPVNYRAVGGTQADGGDGAFAPGRSVTIAEIEAADGASYTAAFSERVIGSGIDEPNDSNYAIVETIPSEPSGAVPDGAAWRGDAGSDWSAPGWTSTHLNHAMAPGSRPSQIEAGGRSAYIGASSGHLHGVYVLKVDGSVRAYSLGVDLKVWKALARIGDGAQVKPGP